MWLPARCYCLRDPLLPGALTPAAGSRCLSRMPFPKSCELLHGPALPHEIISFISFLQIPPWAVWLLGKCCCIQQLFVCLFAVSLESSAGRQERRIHPAVISPEGGGRFPTQAQCAQVAGSFLMNLQGKLLLSSQCRCRGCPVIQGLQRGATVAKRGT